MRLPLPPYSLSRTRTHSQCEGKWGCVCLRLDPGEDQLISIQVSLNKSLLTHVCMCEAVEAVKVSRAHELLCVLCEVATVQS